MAVTVGILKDEAGNYFLPQTDASLVSGLSAHTLPAGGQVGQVLAKATSSDYDVHWVNQSGGGGDPNAVLFTPQTLTDVQKAQARTNIGIVVLTAEEYEQITPDENTLYFIKETTI